MRRTDRDPYPSPPRRPGRRRPLTLAAALVALALSLAASTAAAGAQSTGSYGFVDVVQVSGFLDEINAELIERSIDRAERDDAIALVLQVNSTRSVLSDERFIELADRIAGSRVPVSMWVGPSGSKAHGGVAQLAGIVEGLAIAPSSTLGDMGEQILPVDRFGLLFGDLASRLTDGTIGYEDSLELGVGREAPTLGFFVFDIDGFASEVDQSGDEPVRRPLSAVRFTKLALMDQLLHTVASPAVAYLLLLIGGGLLIFEFYTAGVGIAGMVGAVSLVLAGYGLDVLPTRGWALALLVLALFGYAVDVQTGVPRAWSVIATVCLVVGSLFLFAGSSISWITLVVGIVGLASAMVSGMPSMVRARFGTPTIGREWMVGEMGTASDDVDPDGTVIVRDAPWRARTNRATPIAAGERVRVVAIEGLSLEVEPETGGAKDYRDRS